MRLTELRPEAASAVQAVRAALRTVSERTNSNQTFEKGQLDLTTGTDIESQAVIRAILESAHPDLQFVGEEGAPAAPPAGAHWLVDPLCGTRNFASQLPLYCVNIALVEGGSVVLGAVGDAAVGDVWIAERGRGAFRERQSGLERIHADPASSTISLDPGRPGGPAPAKAAAVMGAAILAGRWELRTLGSSLDLAYLAAGRLGAVWHFSQIPPLHFAAGSLLATEAGALVTDDRGVAWTTESTSLVAAAGEEIHASLLRLLH